MRPLKRQACARWSNRVWGREPAYTCAIMCSRGVAIHHARELRSVHRLGRTGVRRWRLAMFVEGRTQWYAPRTFAQSIRHVLHTRSEREAQRVRTGEAHSPVFHASSRYCTSLECNTPSRAKPSPTMRLCEGSCTSHRHTGLLELRCTVWCRIRSWTASCSVHSVSRLPVNTTRHPSAALTP